MGSLEPHMADLAKALRTSTPPSTALRTGQEPNRNRVEAEEKVPFLGELLFEMTTVLWRTHTLEGEVASGSGRTWCHPVLAIVQVKG